MLYATVHDCSQYGTGIVSISDRGRREADTSGHTDHLIASTKQTLAPIPTTPISTNKALTHQKWSTKLSTCTA